MLPQDSDMIQAIHTMLIDHWDDVARLAWASYQHYSRGAVVVDFRSFDSLPAQPNLAGYAQAAQINANDPQLAPLRELVALYDPAHEVVFIIFSPDGDTMIDLIKTPSDYLSPPEAATK